MESKPILDLDLVENFVHPYWELLDPNPDIEQLFQQCNKLFFGGQFTKEDTCKLTLEWMNTKTDLAGEFNPKNTKIHLFDNVLKKYLRKDIIDTFIHEMIHAYLCFGNMESKDRSYHGWTFIEKLNEINAKANVEITVEHEYTTTYGDERYMWRCANNCRKYPPYFGFVWLKEDREPAIGDPMYKRDTYKIHCDHMFERISNNQLDAKKSLTQWQCIEKFVTETKHLCRIQSHNINVLDEHHKQEILKAFEFDHSICVDSNANDKCVIDQKFFANYDSSVKSLVDVRHLNGKFSFTKFQFFIVCMICETRVPNSGSEISKHLEECTGLVFELPPKEELPLLKLVPDMIVF